MMTWIVRAWAASLVIAGWLAWWLFALDVTAILAFVLFAGIRNLKGSEA